MRRRALLVASAASGGGKIDNFVSIEQNGVRFNIIFDYPCDVPLRVSLEFYDKLFVSVPAGTSSYNLGLAPEAISIVNIEPQSNSMYNYLW